MYLLKLTQSGNIPILGINSVCLGDGNKLMSCEDALINLSLQQAVVITQVQGHIAGSPRPSPPAVRVLLVDRENTSASFFLVDSRWLGMTLG